MVSRITDDNFVKYVHRALRHLYEPVELRLSPLVGWLRLNPQVDAPSELRRILLEAIHAVKPGPKVPPESNAWRIYQVLCYRFDEQFSQEDVAGQMAVSPRQVRRLEFVAIRALADSLARQYGVTLTGSGQTLAEEPAASDSTEIELGGEAGESASQSEVGSQSEVASQSEVGSQSEVASQSEVGSQSEFDWLKKSYHREATDVARLVESALKTGEAMLQAMSTRAVAEIPAGLSPVIGQMTTLRQALLNLLIAGSRSCPRGIVHLRAGQAGEQVILDVWAETGDPAGGPGAGLPANTSADRQDPTSAAEFLDMARRLAELSEGRLEVQPVRSGHSFAVQLVMPVMERYNVLIIDDNEDSLRLLQRYLEGTQFIFLSEQDPEQVIARAEQDQPRVILLDIMLPDIDGWEILGRLRAHPSLGNVPVIISTILPHEQLAASLGASGFLRKPVSREILLRALQQQIDRPEPGSR
jgi:CheY-like chemotaxis protein